MLLLQNCSTENSPYSKIPAITLNKVEQLKLANKDSVIDIIIGYTDGDGNIGLDLDDTTAPYNYGSKYFYNLYVNVYRVDNGIATKIPIPLTTDTVNFNDRITNITPTGKSKSISGEIRFSLNAKPYPGIFPDSMFYTFQIIDRALNESNIVKTNVMKFVF